jgi:hypothetical protein
MSDLDDLARKIGIAVPEKLAELRALFDNPDPAVAEQARTDVAMLTASLQLMERNRAVAERTRRKRESGQLLAEWISIAKHYRKVQRDEAHHRRAAEAARAGPPDIEDRTSRH